MKEILGDGGGQLSFQNGKDELKEFVAIQSVGEIKTSVDGILFEQDSHMIEPPKEEKKYTPPPVGADENDLEAQMRERQGGFWFDRQRGDGD